MLDGGPLAGGVPRGAFGARLQALVGLLSGSYRLSKRLIQALLADAFGVPLSVGTVCGLQQQVSRALALPVEEARRHLGIVPILVEIAPHRYVGARSPRKCPEELASTGDRAMYPRRE